MSGITGGTARSVMRMARPASQSRQKKCSVLPNALPTGVRAGAMRSKLADRWPVLPRSLRQETLKKPPRRTPQRNNGTEQDRPHIIVCEQNPRNDGQFVVLRLYVHQL